ncbi:cytochrome c [Opitutaceae bacterium TAV4]|nr:cytochrome c [Opitutaceae bacterium TAV4]RRK02306.1 cytochrome c [Opitutaceae bacterium TAV3]
MRTVYLATFFIVVLAVSILGFRGTNFSRPPLEIFSDMDHQAKYKPQAQSQFFADGRADRSAPAGVVAFGRSATTPDPDFLRADTAYYAGKNTEGTFAKGFPSQAPVTAALLERGAERYAIYCAPCHGALGDGNGITKAYGMGATPTYHDDRLRTMAEGEIYNTILHGKGNMLSYADKLDAHDRWAVIAYVRALQRAQHATPADVPAAHRTELGLK